MHIEKCCVMNAMAHFYLQNLSVFPIVAEQALTNSYAIYRLRPLCEGTSLSMQVAKRCAGMSFVAIDLTVTVLETY